MNSQLAPLPPIFLTRAEVQRRVGLGRSAIYRRISEGRFPRPVRDIDSEAAYRRRKLREKHAALMLDWYNYLTGNPGG